MTSTLPSSAVELDERFTSDDLDQLPDNGWRYEIINGELLVSKQPNPDHQKVCGNIYVILQNWSWQTGAGEPYFAPGVIFAPDDDVAPDIIWVRPERIAAMRAAGQRFREAPDLVAEVLSPGAANRRRDRELKLGLYSRQGVHEYWIVDWRARTVEIYRRSEAGLERGAVLGETDTLTSPILPGFSQPVADLFRGLLS